MVITLNSKFTKGKLLVIYLHPGVTVHPQQYALAVRQRWKSSNITLTAPTQTNSKHMRTKIVDKTGGYITCPAQHHN